MKKIIYLILAAILSSCTYHFELDEVDACEKLVLYCFPSNKDTTVIQLSKSVPVSKREPLDKSVRNADIHFTVNGAGHLLERGLHFIAPGTMLLYFREVGKE